MTGDGAGAPASRPLGPDDVPGGVSVNKVLFIDMDGVRFDTLRAVPTPHIDALAARGQFGPSYIPDNALGPTMSGHGHANLLTGVWVDKHRSPDNAFTNTNFEQYPDVFTRLAQASAGFSTFSTADWTPLNENILGVVGVKMQQTGEAGAETDEKSVAAAERVLADRDPDAMFVYLHSGDAAGHAFGVDSDAYTEAIARLDGYVGRLIAALDARASRADEEWLILASTDHGLVGRDHGGDEHATRTAWILAVGEGIPATGAAVREWRQVDIVPTILRHLGVAVDPAWGLDGIPIGTASTDPFDAVAPAFESAVDLPAKPPFSQGWTKQTPEGWTIVDETSAVGAREFRGWSFMSGEFWSTSGEGEGRGSFVRGRDVIAVADPAAWGSAGEPATTGARWESTLYSPWRDTRSGHAVEVSFVHHYRQTATSAQRAEVIVEFDDGSDQVVWSRDATQGELFEISVRVEAQTVVPDPAARMRVGWRLCAGPTDGFWAVDAPEISA